MKSLVKIGLALLMVVGLAGCGKGNEVVDIPVEEQEEVKETIRTNSVFYEPANPSNEQILAFNELSDAVNNGLSATEIAPLVTKCFAFDFFSLKNKTGQDDLGGLTYLPDDRVDEFRDYAVTHYYQNYDSIVNEYGSESLPLVKAVNVSQTTNTIVNYQGIEFNGFVVEASVEYQKTNIPETDLKTQIKATLIESNNVAVLIALE